MWEKYPRQNPDTPTRTIEGEAIVITPDDSRMHNLNPTATFIWDRADGAQTLEQIFQAMHNEFEVSENELRNDILAFVKESQTKGMIDIFDDSNPL